MGQLQLDEDELQTLAAAAITAAMGPEEREELITTALKSLLQKEDRGFGSRYQSPLHTAFKDACQKVAKGIAEEMIQKDEKVRGQIVDMVKEATERVVVRDREETVNRLAAAIRSAFFHLEESH